MPIFLITDWKLEKKVFVENKKGVSMVIVMKRKITSEMLTTYFPSLLLTAITFATTFFISKMEGLPPTSDIKLIDIWLVLCQMVPFVEVVLLTAMEYNREDKKKRKKSKKKKGKKARNLKTTSLVVAPFYE